MSDKLALVAGDIGKTAVAARVVETAIATFSSIDALVNNAGDLLCQALHGVHPARIRGISHPLGMRAALQVLRYLGSV